MTVFSRLSDIVNANINALLDRAEDPAKLIRLVIQEMEDTLVEVRSSAVRTIAERREIERRIVAITAERDEWARKAEFALTRNREDLAKGALMAKATATSSLAAEEQILAGLVAGLAAQSDDLAKLQTKLAEARAREKSLSTRRATATNQLKIRARLHDQRAGDAFAKFERIERALDEMEGKVEAYDLGRPRTLHEDFADMEADEQVQAELAALKAKINPDNVTKE